MIVAGREGSSFWIYPGTWASTYYPVVEEQAQASALCTKEVITLPISVFVGPWHLERKGL